jgi:hypothetical protein
VQGATLTTGKNGAANSAYHFAGNDYLKINASSAVKKGTLSVSAWVKRDGSGDFYQTVFRNSTMTFYVASSLMYLDYSAWSAGVASISFGSGASIGTNWAHVVYVVDTPNKSAKFYFNGAYAGGRSLTQDADIPSGPNLYIGRNVTYDSGGQVLSQEGFQGVIDDIRIYNRALSENEISQLYALDAK